MATEIITNTGFDYTNIPAKGLADLARDFEEVQVTDDNGFQYYSHIADGLGASVLTGFGSGFIYDEDGIVNGGKLVGILFHIAPDNPDIFFSPGKIVFDGFEATVEELNNPEFWVTLLDGANKIELTDQREFFTGISNRVIEIDAGGGDDYVMDQLLPSAAEGSEGKIPGSISGPVKVDLGSGNDKITQSANGLDYVIDGGEGEDTIVYEGNKDDISFTHGEDGSIIVTTKDSGTDKLTNVENVSFGDSDETYSIAELVQDTAKNKVKDDPEKTQYLVADDEVNTFVIEGKSSEYGWGPTLDGKGIVVWHLEDETHDILWGFTQIEFSDATVPISFWQLPAIHFDDPDNTQYLEGTQARHDSFFIEGNAEDYGWGKTEDDEGIVIWHHETGTHDILYDFDAIEFKDESVLVSDIM